MSFSLSATVLSGFGLINITSRKEERREDVTKIGNRLNIATVLCTIGAIGVIIAGALHGGYFHADFWHHGITQAVTNPRFYVPLACAGGLSVIAGIFRATAWKSFWWGKPIDGSMEYSKALRHSKNSQLARTIIDCTGLGYLCLPLDIIATGVRIANRRKAQHKVAAAARGPLGAYPNSDSE